MCDAVASLWNAARLDRSDVVPGVDSSNTADPSAQRYAPPCDRTGTMVLWRVRSVGRKPLNGWCAGGRTSTYFAGACCWRLDTGRIWIERERPGRFANP